MSRYSYGTDIREVPDWLQRQYEPDERDWERARGAGFTDAEIARHGLGNILASLSVPAVDDDA